MPELVMLCPSRGRPGNVDRLIRAFESTADPARTELVIAVDDDDPVLSQYTDLIAGGFRSVRWYVWPRLRLARTLNRMCTLLSNETFAVGFLGDDHLPRTRGWDARYIDALRELGTGIVYGNDLLQGERLPTELAMTVDIPFTLGWFCPPGMTHMYLDNAWLWLGRQLDRITYLPDVIVEHMHPVADKADWDYRYYEVNSQQQYAQDSMAYEIWLDSTAAQDVARVRSIMRERHASTASRAAD